ncbi:Small nuclear ribonucleoprotein SmF [Penicillium taxi]|uniref:Small nuclear ribonucleoprotein SmF n=1 Tax=Penicillium taxi TaxID=168475 RepID=UPI0025458756|nr:Small nuclear ribonucleoprotein SmF [Penicillium taxi]KAJ5893692.1 Small nuclear ribonucleoprotein SmF [Penicillium taxi]
MDYCSDGLSSNARSQLTFLLQLAPLNPRPFLQAKIGTEILVRLKWGQSEYKGTLQSVDSYMNLLLHNTEEFVDGDKRSDLGIALIRCNNILYVSSWGGIEMTNMEYK